MRDPDAIVRELTEGRGYVVLEGLFDRETVAEAKARLIELATIKKSAGGDPLPSEIFQGEDQIYNLINKGRVFEHMAEEPTILAVFSRILGSQLLLGSLAARIVRRESDPLPAHLDYPYWDYYKQETFPMGLNGSFFLNCQATIMIDDFTTENGATLVAPGTQRHAHFPTEDEFAPASVAATGPAGTAMLMTGLLWHRSGVNHTATPRIGVLGQYLAKFVKPMEDQRRGVRQEVIDRASPTLRALLGVDYPYPQLLDISPKAKV
jgi:ectoine hydroxylase-related dioxygenase (phytanoyl-CoA dioxygenase family)